MVAFSIFMVGSWACTDYSSNDHDADGGEYLDASDATDGESDGEFHDGDIDSGDDDGCRPLDVRAAGCITFSEFGWAHCPLDPPPEDCREDCPYIGKSNCLKWWDDNICLGSEGALSSLEPDYSIEKVVLGVYHWPAPYIARITINGEKCLGFAKLSVDSCIYGGGMLDPGMLFAVVIPKDLEPSFLVGTVSCGELCDQTDWCDDEVGVLMESGCAPYTICP